MKYRNIIWVSVFLIGIIVLLFGSYIFSLTVIETKESVKLFGFVLSTGLLVIGTLLLIIIFKYSPLPKYKKIDSSGYKKYILSSINWFYFVMILLVLIVNLLLIGVIFFLTNEWFWRLYGGFVTVSIAMIVSYVPWFDLLKKKIWNASPFSLFILFMVLIFVMIFLFIFHLYF